MKERFKDIIKMIGLLFNLIVNSQIILIFLGISSYRCLGLSCKIELRLWFS